MILRIIKNVLLYMFIFYFWPLWKIDIIQKVLTKFNDAILIGAWSNNILTKGVLNICADEEKIQIISDKSTDEIIDLIQSHVNTKHKIISKVLSLSRTSQKLFTINIRIIYLLVKPCYWGPPVLITVELVKKTNEVGFNKHKN